MESPSEQNESPPPDFFPRQRFIVGDYRQDPAFRGFSRDGKEFRIMMEPLQDASGKVKICNVSIIIVDQN